MISSLSFYAQSIFLPPMDTYTRLKAIAGIFLGCALLIVSPANAQDASIDRLLSKLPPPEKIAKPNLQKALQQNDPAEKDPLVKQIIKAELTRNFPRALGYSRTLVQRYPRSAGAQCLRGSIALALRQYGEASAALRASIALRPNLALAHYLLALMEGRQGHYAAAIPHLERVKQIEPKAAVTYYALSDCLLRIGRNEEGLTYAKRAAELAPSNVFMWIQLAKAERALGHKEATLGAMTKAAEVAPDSGPIFAVSRQLHQSEPDARRYRTAGTRRPTDAARLPCPIAIRLLLRRSGPG
jgi:tetratricopeptide (TPR) repeat protein